MDQLQQPNIQVPEVPRWGKKQKKNNEKVMAEKFQVDEN